MSWLIWSWRTVLTPARVSVAGIGSLVGAARTGTSAGGGVCVVGVRGGSGRTVFTRVGVTLARCTGLVAMTVIGSSSTSCATCATACDAAPPTVSAIADTPARSADALKLRRNITAPSPGSGRGWRATADAGACWLGLPARQNVNGLHVVSVSYLYTEVNHWN